MWSLFPFRLFWRLLGFSYEFLFAKELDVKILSPSSWSHDFWTPQLVIWKMSCFAEPDPPIRLEKMEETTNRISLALEIQEESLRTKPGRSLGSCFLFNRGLISLCKWFQLICHLCVWGLSVLVELQAINTQYQLWRGWNGESET